MGERIVLSIDGGGIRGIIPAVVLTWLERELGRPISACVDLIAGTSTGGILATGLSRDAAGPIRSAAEILDLYMTRGPEIFHSSLAHNISTGWGTLDEKYPADGLEDTIRAVVGDRTLDDLTSNLLVTTYETAMRRPFYFGSGAARTEGRVSPLNFSLTDVTRATSAAPTYFEAFQARSPAGDGRTFCFIDGGVFANNPTGVAYAVARKIFPGDVIHVVSLGTGLTERPYHWEDIKDWGALEWARPIIAIMMDGVSDATGDQMRDFITDGYWRFDINLTDMGPGNPAPDDDMDDASPENLQRLKQRGELLVRSEQERLREVLATLKGRAVA